MKSISSGAWASGPFETVNRFPAPSQPKLYALRMPRAITSICGTGTLGSRRHITAVMSTSPILPRCGSVPASPESVREPLLT
jgi:hypothetical protein